MKYGAFLLMAIALFLSADEGAKSVVSLDVLEGKKVYVPIKPPIDLSKEVYIQEDDQNTTHHGSKK